MGVLHFCFFGGYIPVTSDDTMVRFHFYFYLTFRLQLFSVMLAKHPSLISTTQISDFVKLLLSLLDRHFFLVNISVIILEPKMVLLKFGWFKHFLNYRMYVTPKTTKIFQVRLRLLLIRVCGKKFGWSC